MEQRLFKSVPYFDIKADAKGRTRKGIAAVFGNVDSWGDRIMPGAFTKTISEGRSRVKHLWNHDFSTPPIASITELKEVSRDELPEAVLAFAPEATGGLMVAREYYSNDLASWVLEGIDKGDVCEMSFGYNIVKSNELVVDEDIKIRELTELMLMDTSDVNWGMNAATVAAGAKNSMPLGAVAQNLLFYASEAKAGRRNAHADLELIKGIHGALVTLGYGDCMPLEIETDPPKSNEAEAALTGTSLDFLKLKRRRLEVAGAHHLRN